MLSKWDYLYLISSAVADNRTSFAELKDRYGVKSLDEITLKQAREFWEKIKRGNAGD